MSNVRTNYQKLHTYNSKPRGTVQGPIVQKLSLTNMQNQQPLYPQVNHGYNALTFGGSDNAYYKINNGPYSQSCSLNKGRTCTGQMLRENYHQERNVNRDAQVHSKKCRYNTSPPQDGGGCPDCKDCSMTSSDDFCNANSTNCEKCLGSWC